MEQLDVITRQKIREVLGLLGPYKGTATMKRIFEEVPRAELEHQLRCYRRQVCQGKRIAVTALRWLEPGKVWAMDFCAPPKAIDNRYRYILVVRDLGSGKTLLSLPVVDRCTVVVCYALRALFKQYGPPVVLKSDNAKEFKSEEVRKLLAAEKVQPLLSPKYWPRYNGAVEAGIGTLKTYCHHEAARNDRPGEWNCDDVEAARLRANELARPFGKDGPSPQARFAQRMVPTKTERTTFEECVRSNRRSEMEQAEIDKGGPLNLDDRAAVERQAITLALVACGLLMVRRRRISPPFRSQIWSNNT